MSQNPVKQHIVPEVYLKRFSHDNRDNVFRLNVKPFEWKHQIKTFNVSQVCYAPDYYTIETKDSLRRLEVSDEYLIEKEGFTYENTFLTQIFNKLANSDNELLGRQRAKKLIKMLLSIKRRNPSFQRPYLDGQILDKVADNQMEALRRTEAKFQAQLKAKGIPSLADQVEKLFRANLKDERYVRDMYREGFLKDLEENDYYDNQLVDDICQLTFFVFKTTPDYPFITSDNPGGMLMKDETVRNIAFNPDFFSFFFPIDSQNLFVFLNSNKEKPTTFKKVQYRFANKWFVDFANQAALSLCNQHVFSSDKGMLEAIRKKFLDD